MAAFFGEPWSRVSLKLGERDQAWLLSMAAIDLRALGRLTEALQPMRASVDMAVQRKDWKNAAISASNLSELEVTLARLPDAVADAQKSVEYADKSRDPFQWMARRASAAAAMHASGRVAEAGDLLNEAERKQKEMRPESDVLSSLGGFWYCDWLLAPPERAAWLAVIRAADCQDEAEKAGENDSTTLCADVERRAKSAHRVAIRNHWLRDVALAQLTLARVGLIREILAQPLPQPTLELSHLAAAVNGVRAAGRTDLLPAGLLTAALYHFARGDEASARIALDQAQQIAERGPMPLYLADVHLHRARLFRDRSELAKARALIEKHGYWRRKEELEDAESAAKNWPTAATTKNRRKGSGGEKATKRRRR
jgi:hypothetical protein